MGFKTHWIYDIHVTRYSCLIVSLRETSFTLRGATQGMLCDVKMASKSWILQNAFCEKNSCYGAAASICV